MGIKDMSVLPEPAKKGKISLEEVIAKRRSCRSFTGKALTPQQISQILWAGQGITGSKGLRAAPSAGATYPLTLYVSLPEGVFRYVPEDHSLTLIKSADIRVDLARASVEQYFMTKAGMIVIIAARFERTTSRYGRRGERYVILEAGHCAENMFLQAEALGLGSVAIGAYNDGEIATLAGLEKSEQPLLLVAIGHKTNE